jgi:hypothetical protein
MPAKNGIMTVRIPTESLRRVPRERHRPPAGRRDGQFPEDGAAIGRPQDTSLRKGQRQGNSGKFSVSVRQSVADIPQGIG